MDEAVAGVLRTKLYAPGLPDIIPREKLLQELDAAKTAKLISIVAGAGYSKSTLAAPFPATHKAFSLWYQLGETDQDLSVFIAYLVVGIGWNMEDSGKGHCTACNPPRTSPGKPGAV